MDDKEKQQLKINLEGRLQYFYAELDGTYHIPDNVEGVNIALALIVFCGISKRKVFLYNEKNPKILHDIAGVDYRRRRGYEKVG